MSSFVADLRCCPIAAASFSFWQQYLGGDAGAVGRTVYLDGVPYTVVGIMPREFRTQFADRRWLFWTPYVVLAIACANLAQLLLA
jgi:hypothetical protein